MFHMLVVYYIFTKSGNKQHQGAEDQHAGLYIILLHFSFRTIGLRNANIKRQT